MKTIFISNQSPNTLCSIFKDMGLNLVLLPPDPSLPEPVSSHADMLMFGNIVQKDYYERNNSLFAGHEMILAEEEFGNEYPQDVLLNAFAVNDTLFGRLESLCEKVKKLYPKTVNLRQGYAKCSTLLFGSNAITSDKGIFDILSKNGTDTLLISPGHILLHGYDYGFIGGSSFTYENKVIFFGNIEEHPDYSIIKDFIENKGYQIIFDKSFPLTDLGGAMML